MILNKKEVSKEFDRVTIAALDTILEDFLPDEIVDPSDFVVAVMMGQAYKGESKELKIISEILINPQDKMGVLSANSENPISYHQIRKYIAASMNEKYNSALNEDDLNQYPNEAVKLIAPRMEDAAATDPINEAAIQAAMADDAMPAQAAPVPVDTPSYDDMVANAMRDSEEAYKAEEAKKKQAADAEEEQLAKAIEDSKKDEAADAEEKQLANAIARSQKDKACKSENYDLLRAEYNSLCDQYAQQKIQQLEEEDLELAIKMSLAGDHTPPGDDGAGPAL